MKLRALAKINLGLDVTGKREDGYHEVRMVMQTIQMYDQLEIKESKEPGIRLTTNLPFLPCNDGNLVYKAAKLLMDEFDIRQGVDMNLTKFIPVAAGMAGGSSDAAAALVGINRMFQLGLTKRQLMERGVQIGADVPYCVMRGTALAEGIGEKLTSLPGVPMCYVLIGKPGINVSTKFVYGNLHLDAVTEHPDIDGMVEAIRNHDLYGITDRMGNVLESVTCPAYPVIDEIKAQMMKNGAVNAMMSGSGRNVDAGNSQTVLLVFYGTCADRNIGENIGQIAPVGRIQHFVCRSQISLFYYTHMHFTHGDQAVQQVRLSFRVRLMNDTFVAFTCGTRFVGIDTRDDDQFVGYFVGNLCQTVIVLQNSVFVVCGARSYDNKKFIGIPGKDFCDFSVTLFFDFGCAGA